MDKLQIEKTVVAYRTLVREVIALLKIKCEEKGLTLTLTDDSTLPNHIVTDSARLRQILINVLGNSIKFTAEGKVHLLIRQIVKNGEPKLGFEIEDTGIGLNDVQMSRLFQPFSQGDASMNRRFGGSGLGLDISRRLARALGGDVEILRSQLGLGSTFLVTVALEFANLASPEVSTAAPVTKRPTPLDNLEILVVDDNHDNQLLIGSILKRHGASVTFADDGASGVTAATNSKFDLILMDIQMPIMNGYQATRALRAQGSKIPIIALTANALPEDREACLAAGCSDYLVKPIQIAGLISALQRHSLAT